MTAGSARTAAWTPRNLLIVGGVVIVAFLMGFLWQWMEARDARAERDEVRIELAFERLENQLASAVIQTENDSYERARELMSGFFTDLQSEVQAAPADARRELEELLARRDAVITALSRSDPAAGELLRRMYTRYQVAMGGPELGIPIPAPMPADTLPTGDTGGAPGVGPDTSGGGDGQGAP